MIRPKLVVIALYGLVVAGSLGIWAYFFWPVAEPSVSAPKVVMTEVVEFGEKERGEVVVGQIDISNQGNAELLIDDQRSSCSCTGLVDKPDTHFSRYESIVVPPGESRKVYARLTVNANVGFGMNVYIYVRTNDPKHPQKRVELVVKQVTGGAYASPPSLQFGTVRRGQEVTRTIEIRDTAQQPRKLKEVTSTNPAILAARILPPDVQPVRYEKDDRWDKCIALVEVKIRSEVPQFVNERLHLKYDSAPTLNNEITISGYIQDTFHITPSTLTLPRHSTTVKLYEALCTLRSTEAGPFQFTVKNCPDHVKITKVAKDDVGMQTLLVILDHAKAPEELKEHLIILECSQPGSAEVIPVSLKVITSK